MTIKVSPTFEIGEFVYLKTDPEQLLRQVHGYILRANSVMYYEIMCGTQFSTHSDFELSRTKNSEITILLNH